MKRMLNLVSRKFLLPENLVILFSWWCHELQPMKHHLFANWKKYLTGQLNISNYPDQKWDLYIFLVSFQHLNIHLKSWDDTPWLDSSANIQHKCAAQWHSYQTTKPYVAHCVDILCDWNQHNTKLLSLLIKSSDFATPSFISKLPALVLSCLIALLFKGNGMSICCSSRE